MQIHSTRVGNTEILINPSSPKIPKMSHDIHSSRHGGTVGVSPDHRSIGPKQQGLALQWHSSVKLWSYAPSPAKLRHRQAKTSILCLSFIALSCCQAYLARTPLISPYYSKICLLITYNWPSFPGELCELYKVSRRERKRRIRVNKWLKPEGNSL